MTQGHCREKSKKVGFDAFPLLPPPHAMRYDGILPKPSIILAHNLGTDWPIVPLSKPGIIAAVIFGFLLGSISFLFPLALSTSWSVCVVPVGIASFSAQHIIAWNELMAAAVLSTIPKVYFCFCS